MVRFAPHVPPLILVRETIPLVDAYRSAEGCRLPDPCRPALDPDPPTPDDFDPGPTPALSASRSSPADDGPVLDPFDDADAQEELEEEITTLAAHIHAATHRLLTLIADFDHRRGWELGGHRTCAHWLSFCTGIIWGRPGRRCVRPEPWWRCL